ncbi:DHA2 family efflux MFS transporter permease subunit [Nitrosococcus watsonii]|uniref:Drug resistance transporter, EmrB/QacA subfamily n=1 Tax=Nitrosococcus watsoni (strain C-113) TaxID=105559 RepID=D8K892_NITWC|nr:DHA2 family efflux MFS transporter permease subunit [Nitrosococcus watsonii]ADJ27087.1 drug resistance transporter, EmrB/QacA subfamily [Nitrosococcus watsonii C-113]
MAEFKPLRGTKLVFVTIALALAVFMNVLDVSIANVSIPTIAGHLAVSSTQGVWIITSFAVSSAVTVPISGWLAKRYGEVRLFAVCTFLFTVFSFLCGASSGFGMLLIMRALQGAVAGPMIPISQSLLLGNYPPEKHGLANGIWGMTATVGPAAGPVLGGWITDHISWSWIFYINVPIGIVAAAAIWILLKERETEIEKLPIDTIGLSLLILGVGSLQIMLDQGNDHAWFQSNYIIVLGIVAIVALGYWIIWEWTDEKPIVDLKLFKRRNFALACAALFFGYMAFFTAIVIFPLWLQSYQGYNATWAGFATSSLAILAIVFSPIVGRLADKIDVRILVTIGFSVFAGVSFLTAYSNTQISFGRMFLERLPWGIGIACFFIPLITLSLSGLPANRIASASGLFNFLRQIALSIGASLSVTLWDRRSDLHDHHLTAAVSNYNDATLHWLAQLQQLGMSHLEAAKSLEKIISKQAFMMGANDIFWLSGWIFLALIIPIWFSRPEQGGQDSGE